LIDCYLESINANPALALISPANGGNCESAMAGFSVASAGDVNGDGFDDVIAVARGTDSGGTTDQGAAYVLFGHADAAATIDLTALDGTNGFRIDGESAGDLAGYAVSGTGDVNGDGYADVILAAPFADPDGVNAAGKTYVVFGGSAFNASITLDFLDGSNGLVLNGISSGDNAGFAVTGGADLNHDGFDDSIVAAPFTGNNSGDVYVVFGGIFNGAVTKMGNISANNLNGTPGDDVIIGSLEHDRINGRGGADVLKGGGGDDTLIYRPSAFRIEGDTGNDRLDFVGGNVFPDLTNLPNGTITGIERINIRGTLNNHLGLDITEVLDISDNNLRRVPGNGDDSISTADGCSRVPGQTVIGANSFIRYVSDGATLLVDTDIDRGGIILG